MARAWIGNTERIAERHYLQVPDEFFDLANGSEKNTEPTEHEAAQYPAALSGKERIAKPPDGAKNTDLRLSAAKCLPVNVLQMETKGIEQSPFLPPKTQISKTQRTKSGTPKDENDSDLAWLTEHWPNLPESVRKQIITMARDARNPGEARK